MTALAPPFPLGNAPNIDDWLSVNRHGRVEIFTGRVELGQGAITGIREMAACALDCDSEALTILSGHTGCTPDEGFTAGSFSIARGGVAVRWAASALREIILANASDTLGVARDRLALRDFVILLDGKPCKLDFADLACDVDLHQPVTDWAAPNRKPALPRAAPKRLGLRNRVAGAPFLHDMRRPGQLFGRPVHPPSPNSKLERLGIEAIAGRPGVVEVVQDGSFVGIIASTEIAAVHAARWARHHARWQTQSFPIDNPCEHIASSKKPVKEVFRRGDPTPQTGTRISTTVSRPFLHHASIGPSTAMAEFAEGKLTVWSHSQGVYALRGALAQVLSMKIDDVVVIHAPGAGCYGHNGADDVALDAALMARVVPGRPVHVVWDRVDEFRAAPLGPAMTTRAEAWLDPEGAMQTMLITVNSPAHGQRPGTNGAPNLLAALHLDKKFPTSNGQDIPFERGGGAERNAVPYYTIPNVSVGKRIVSDLPQSSSSLRGLGAFLNVYAIETLIDEIAAELNEDSVKYRLRHLDDERAKTVIRRAVDMANSPADREQDKVCGWGMGFARYKNISGYCAVMVRIELQDEVRVTHACVAADVGEVIDADGVRNQIEGGLIQSLSWALKEEVQFEGSAVATQSWLDYPIFRFSDVPEIQVNVIERPGMPPLGCGEIAQGPTVAALGNAVRNVIGSTVRDLPISRSRLLRILSE